MSRLTLLDPAPRLVTTALLLTTEKMNAVPPIMPAVTEPSQPTEKTLRVFSSGRLRNDRRILTM
jgi:hypothetical protein